MRAGNPKPSPDPTPNPSPNPKTFSLTWLTFCSNSLLKVAGFSALKTVRSMVPVVRVSPSHVSVTLYLNAVAAAKWSGLSKAKASRLSSSLFFA